MSGVNMVRLLVCSRSNARAGCNHVCACAAASLHGSSMLEPEAWCSTAVNRSAVLFFTESRWQGLWCIVVHTRTMAADIQLPCVVAHRSQHQRLGYGQPARRPAIVLESAPDSDAGIQWR